MRVIGVASLLIASTVLVSTFAVAEDTKLTIKPNKCVALRKGEKCYQSVVLNYSAARKSDVCLIRDDEVNPLICWKNTASAKYRYRIAASKSFWFRIVDSDQSDLASVQFNVAWVYKQSRKRNRWRLF